MSLNKEKFNRLVHYVIWRVGDQPGFGATKLNKVLWFADARAYGLTGEPITGAAYIREKWGPVPRAMMPAQKELVNLKLIRITGDRAFNHERKRFKALVAPDTSIFSAFEMQTINWWADHIARDHTASTISEESHDYTWEVAGEGEEIPYHAIFASRLRPSEGDELEWAKKRAKELGLN